MQNFKSSVQKITYMFNDIAKKYDLLNHILSFGQDKYWNNGLNTAFRQNTDCILACKYEKGVLLDG